MAVLGEKVSDVGLCVFLGGLSVLRLLLLELSDPKNPRALPPVGLLTLWASDASAGV